MKLAQHAAHNHKFEKDGVIQTSPMAWISLAVGGYSVEFHGISCPGNFNSSKELHGISQQFTAVITDTCVIAIRINGVCQCVYPIQTGSSMNF